jgi:hypothetical protein
MPKSKCDQVIGIRLELQDSEREALDVLVASEAVENIGNGLGAVITPFLNMSPAGAVFLASSTAFLIDWSLTTFNEQRAEVDDLSNATLWQRAVWNFTLPGAVDDIRKGTFVEDRIATAWEIGSRLKSWGARFT